MQRYTRFVKVIPPEQWIVQPWANGGGLTREIVRWPADGAYDVRVSLADVDRDGPFSTFPGYRRWTVLVGAPTASPGLAGAIELVEDVPADGVAVRRLRDRGARPTGALVEPGVPAGAELDPVPALTNVDGVRGRHRLERSGDLIELPGEAPITARLLAGPVTLLNVIARPGTQVGVGAPYNVPRFAFELLSRRAILDTEDLAMTVWVR